MHNLFHNADVRRITVDGTNNTLTAGTSDVNSGIVDTLGFECVTFILAVGTVSTDGDVTMKIQQNTANSGTGMADLEGTEISLSADTDDNKLLVTEIYRPKERYLRAAITRGDGGNSVIDGLIVVLSRPVFAGVTQGATVEAAEFFSNPAEGTA